jgi:guanine deaminase
MTDVEYISRAISAASRSPEEIGCGCVIVQDGKIIAEEYSSQRAVEIAVHHAELKAVYQANRSIGKRVLRGAVAYCSCEPCSMCLAALSYAKVERIVYAYTMKDLFPHDRQSDLVSQEFVTQLNFIPKIEQLVV